MSSKVSIIMPCFNSSMFISQAIDSVLIQKYENWELLICDDGSHDDSIKVIEKYQKNDPRIFLFRNKYHKGAPGARNTSLSYASGRFIAFLDSDDIWYESKLDNQINFMIENDISFSYSYHDVVNEQGAFIHSFLAPEKVNRFTMRYANFIPCLTAIYDSNIFGKVEQPYILKRNDFALWLKILNSSQNISAHCFKEVTAKYRSNSYGLSSNPLEALKYFNLCLQKYNHCSKTASYFYSLIYLFLILLKKKTPNIYNYLVVRVFR